MSCKQLELKNKGEINFLCERKANPIVGLASGLIVEIVVVMWRR